MLTKKQILALSILDMHPDITAGTFAIYYYTEPRHEVLFSAVSNQGNGACHGKKAWLCAGSLLGKLKKKGWVKNKPYSDPPVFSLTDEGRKALEGVCTSGVCRFCGCTGDNACHHPEHGNCWWVDEAHTICSHCAIPDIANDPRTEHPSSGHKRSAQ